MKRGELEESILKQHSELKSCNLKILHKKQLKMFATGEVTIPLEMLVKIFAERNERASVNQQLNGDRQQLRFENHRLKTKLNDLTNVLTDWSKSEIIEAYKKVFNNFTPSDDELLASCNAVSKTTADRKIAEANRLRDRAIEEGENAIKIAEKIGQGFLDEYGDSNHG